MLDELGLAEEKISVRMTGCPNGCARPYQSDIGIVGRSGNKYTLFVGGNMLGNRLNFVFKDLVPFDQIVETLKPLLAEFKANRAGGRKLRRLLPAHRRSPQAVSCGEGKWRPSPRVRYSEPWGYLTASRGVPDTRIPITYQ